MDDDSMKNAQNKTNNEENNELLAGADSEADLKKYPCPKAIFLIISNEFCERFNYYGFRSKSIQLALRQISLNYVLYVLAILSIYLKYKLHYDDDTAHVIYHSFSMCCYFFPVLGGILCDSWWGKYKTILYLSILYAIGSILLSITAIPPLHFPVRGMTMFSLFLIAVGSGGIKPCVSAFGGDQFKMPEQAKRMLTFFSVFYFSINAGSLLSTFLTPILRQDVKCFQQNDCYSLAFGVPGFLMVAAVCIFFVGKKLYVMTEPSGNMMAKVARCIWCAITTKINERKTNPQKHWLDYAFAKHSQQLVNETKVLLNILVLYIPLPVFWSLFDQQGSRWTAQAEKMYGNVGNYEIKPDQMQTLNPFLILLFIPLYDVLFYPILSKIGIRRPLQKLALGGILAGVAFICSGVVELAIEKAEGKSLHILWLTPQYVIITLVEVMFSVTGLSFSYAEAPASMKSVVQSCWLLTVAFGNCIDIIIMKSQLFESQANEFFLFAGLMFAVMGLFILLAHLYKSIPVPDQEVLITKYSDKDLQNKDTVNNPASKND